MNELVSVVIPVYNRSHVLSATLDCLQEQTYKNFEVIIVDDCSDDSDSLQNLIRQYNLNVVYARHETNMHGGAARNTGIALAKGIYIAFLDSDDLWTTNKLEVCLKQNVSDNEILYSQILDRDKLCPKYPFDNTKVVDEYLLVERQSIQTSSLFMKKIVAEKVLFDPLLKRFQDTDFIIRSQKKHKIKFRMIEDILVVLTEADKGSRISCSIDPQPALYWMHKNIDILTNKTISVFIFNRVINYASNSMSRYELVKLFFDYKCYKFIQYLDFKVFVKIFFGSHQRRFRR